PIARGEPREKERHTYLYVHPASLHQPLSNPCRAFRCLPLLYCQTSLQDGPCRLIQGQPLLLAQRDQPLDQLLGFVEFPTTESHNCPKEQAIDQGNRMTELLGARESLFQTANRLFGLP